MNTPTTRDSIYKEFQKNWVVNHFFKGKVLLAVSGGVDSMVMANLFFKNSLNFAIAHVNFSLRSTDSDEDQLFVKKWAEDRGIEFYTVKYNTKEFSLKKKISVEMAARQLRYNWFLELSKEYGFKYIALAHNANDNAETLILNLVRGTGLEGLCGIKSLSDLVSNEHQVTLVRPLLFAERSDIERFAKINNINYRVDKTNLDSTFKRNKIRNEIIPLLAQLNPSIIKTLNENIVHLDEANSFNNSAVDEIFKRIVLERDSLLNNDYISLKNRFLEDSIDFNSLMNVSRYDKIQKYLLSKILYDRYHFSYSISASIIESLYKSIDYSKLYISENYIASVNNRRIDIFKKEILSFIKELESERCTFSIDESFTEKQFLFGGYKFLFRLFSDNYKIEELQNTNTLETKKLYLDYDKVVNKEIIIRSLKEGDKFSPFGMKGKKSVVDFLATKKIPAILKRAIPVIELNQDIISIPGIEISNKYRVKKENSKIIELSIALLEQN